MDRHQAREVRLRCCVLLFSRLAAAQRVAATAFCIYPRVSPWGCALALSLSLLSTGHVSQTVTEVRAR
jgi:hypothetical protein